MKVKALWLGFVIVFLITIGFSSLALANQEEKRVTLTIWDLWTMGAENDGMEAVVQVFMEEYPNIKVHRVTTENEPYKIAIRTALATGTPPDVWFIWPGYTYLGSLADAGVVYDLTDDYGRLGLTERINPTAREQVRWRGRDYCVPVESYVEPMWYSKAIFQNLGIDIPSTWDDFWTIAEKIRDAEIYPIALGNRERWPGEHLDGQMLALAGGAPLVQKVLTAEEKWANDRFIEGQTKLQDMVRSGFFAPGINAMDDKEARMLLYVEKAAMYFMGDWSINDFESEMPNFEYDFFFLPTWRKDVPHTIVGGPNGAFAVAEASEHKEEALLFLEVMTRPEVWQERLKYASGISPIIGATTEEIVGETTMRLLKAYEEAEGAITSINMNTHPELDAVRLRLLQDLFTLKITPEELLCQLDQEVKMIIEREGSY